MVLFEIMASCDAMLQKASGEDLIEWVEGGEKREREGCSR